MRWTAWNASRRRNAISFWRRNDALLHCFDSSCRGFILMLVICYGMAKSGSTLAFEVVRGILMSAGHSQSRVSCSGVSPTARGNFMQTADRASIENLLDYTGDRRILAVKSHHVFKDDMFEWLEELQAARKLQVIASYRDPRDISLSLVDAGDRARQKGKRAKRGGFSKIDGLPSATRQVKKASQNFRKWGALRETLRLYYDTVAFSPDKAIDEIERVLNVKSDRAAVMKHAFQKASTHKNKATRHRYITELDEPGQQQMLEIFGTFIQRVCEQNDDRWFSEYREELLMRIGSPDGRDSTQSVET
jgi:hypothetical protein